MFLTAWIVRQSIYTLVKPKPVAPVVEPFHLLYISDDIKSELTAIVQKSDNIVAIQIVTVDFQRNARLETFAAISNPIIQGIYNRFLASKVVETPFFNDNKANNDRLIRLIKGEFICIPYKESTAYQYAPDAEQIISYVCASGIPPVYGEFSGIMAIYLKKQPDKDFNDQLRWMARDVTVRIFEDNKHKHENK